MNYQEIKDAVRETARLDEEYINDNYNSAMILAEQMILNNSFLAKNIKNKIINIGEGLPEDAITIKSVRCNNYLLDRLDSNLSNIESDDNDGIGYTITDGVLSVHPYRWGVVTANYIEREPALTETFTNYIAENYPFIYIYKLSEIMRSRLQDFDYAGKLRTEYDVVLRDAMKLEFKKVN